MPNQTIEMCNYAISRNWKALKFTTRQTLANCKIAVRQHWAALEFAKCQNNEICEMALSRNNKAYKFIRLSQKRKDQICINVLDKPIHDGLRSSILRFLSN